MLTRDPTTNEEESSHAEKEEDDPTYKVVINHEDQYSIWLADCGPQPDGIR